MLKTTDPETRALNIAIKTLEGLRLQFKVIGPDGTEYGNLIVKEPPKRKLKHPFGAILKHCTPYLKDVKPGGIVFVPAGDLEIASVASSISAWCVKNWGPRSTYTQMNRADNTVKVVRVF